MASGCEVKTNNERQFADLGGIRQQWCEGGRRRGLAVAELLLRARRTTIVSSGGLGDLGDCIASGLNNCLGDICGA